MSTLSTGKIAKCAGTGVETICFLRAQEIDLRANWNSKPGLRVLP